jgi:hypothetical protein
MRWYPWRIGGVVGLSVLAALLWFGALSDYPRSAEAGLGGEGVFFRAFLLPIYALYALAFAFVAALAASDSAARGAGILGLVALALPIVLLIRVVGAWDATETALWLVLLITAGCLSASSSGRYDACLRTISVHGLPFWPARIERDKSDGTFGPAPGPSWSGRRRRRSSWVSRFPS